jgi:hypothetical protein
VTGGPAQDAERDAVALIQAALDDDGEASVLLLGSCDQRETCHVLAALGAWLVSRLAPEDQPVLMGALRKAALGQQVRLASDGHRLSEAAP